jgi:hypothetical protein
MAFFALILAIIAFVWIYRLHQQGKIRNVSAFLKYIFFNNRDGLKMTDWIDDLLGKNRR